MVTPASVDRYASLTAVGPGTPMGSLLRAYWLPAMKASELIADGPPIRLRLLGENLIAFRTASGRIGVLDHRCPHRGASLFLGRNECEGIRCVYHGWKFDADGRCVDMPNVPPAKSLSDRVRALAAYPAHERNGLVWVYMGADDPVPPLPAFAANLLPEAETSIRMIHRSCNWLQALEGDVDTSHVGFLHLGAAKLEDFASDAETRRSLPFLQNRAPEFDTVETDWGVMSGARADGEGVEDEVNWRVSQFVLPFWTMTPGGSLDDHVLARAWLPIDDHNTMFVSLSQHGTQRTSMRGARNGKAIAGVASTAAEYNEANTGWLGRWRLKDNESNDWGLDRATQREESYTGIDTVHLQDQAVTESMGPVVDRSHEHLVASDRMIIAVRRALLRSLEAFEVAGELPKNANDPSLNLRARGGKMSLAAGADWKSAYFERAKLYGDATASR